ncbi:hypothetical protein GQR58_030094 [Nymphon striatum]|nr:hypothetical protein GQR58_030094 [Nymphon striatum]
MHTSRHALAAHADEHGEAAGDESIDVRQQFQVVRLGFAEPDAGIDPHAVGAGVGGDCRSRNHAGKHIIDHVVVAGAVLHGIGRALHVRSNKADPELTGNRTERGAHVIDHARPGSHGGSRHHFVPGVDRDPNGVRRLVDDGLDHGDDPGQFFLDRDRGRARSGRLAADIEQPGTLGDQLATTSDRVVSARSPDFADKRVGRDVHDAHRLTNHDTRLSGFRHFNANHAPSNQQRINDVRCSIFVEIRSRKKCLAGLPRVARWRRVGDLDLVPGNHECVGDRENAVTIGVASEAITLGEQVLDHAPTQRPVAFEVGVGQILDDGLADRDQGSRGKVGQDGVVGEHDRVAVFERTVLSVPEFDGPASKIGAIGGHEKFDPVAAVAHDAAKRAVDAVVGQELRRLHRVVFVQHDRQVGGAVVGEHGPRERHRRRGVAVGCRHHNRPFANGRGGARDNTGLRVDDQSARQALHRERHGIAVRVRPFDLMTHAPTGHRDQVTRLGNDRRIRIDDRGERDLHQGTPLAIDQRSRGDRQASVHQDLGHCDRSGINAAAVDPGIGAVERHEDLAGAVGVRDRNKRTVRDGTAGDLGNLHGAQQAIGSHAVQRVRGAHGDDVVGQPVNVATPGVPLLGSHVGARPPRELGMHRGFDLDRHALPPIGRRCDRERTVVAKQRIDTVIHERKEGERDVLIRPLKDEPGLRGRGRRLAGASPVLQFADVPEVALELVDQHPVDVRQRHRHGSGEEATAWRDDHIVENPVGTCRVDRTGSGRSEHGNRVVTRHAIAVIGKQCRNLQRRGDRSVGPSQAQPFAVGGQRERHMQLGADRDFARREHHQIATGGQRASGREDPSQRSIRIVRQAPARQVDGRTRWVVQLDPVRRAAVAVDDAAAVDRHDLVETRRGLRQALVQRRRPGCTAAQRSRLSLSSPAQKVG